MADPQLIVLGLRKRKENSCFVDNGDLGPLPRTKKVKPTQNSAMGHVPKHQDTHTCGHLDIERGNEHNANAALTTQHTSPQRTDEFSEGVDRGNHGDNPENSSKDPGEDLIDVDREEDEILEESADDELGESI
jgi:hypothetical protein